MKRWKRALCLLLCLILCAAPTAAYASELPDLSDVAETCTDLFVGVLNSLEDLKNSEEVRRIGESLGETMEKYDLDSLGTDLMDLLRDCENLSDAELEQAVRDMGEAHNAKLTDDQVEQLCKLCRRLQKTDSAELKEKLEDTLEDARDAAEKAEARQKKVSGLFQKLRSAAKKVITFVRGFLQKLKKENI